MPTARAAPRLRLIADNSRQPRGKVRIVTRFRPTSRGSTDIPEREALSYYYLRAVLGFARVGRLQIRLGINRNSGDRAPNPSRHMPAKAPCPRAPVPKSPGDHDIPAPLARDATNRHDSACMLSHWPTAPGRGRTARVNPERDRLLVRASVGGMSRRPPVWWRDTIAASFRTARSSGHRLLWRCGWSPRWGAKCIESPAALSNPE